MCNKMYMRNKSFGRTQGLIKFKHKILKTDYTY